jgi:hypothetical protein
MMMMMMMMMATTTMMTYSWWNRIGKKTKVPSETLSQCSFVHHKSHMA